MKDSNKIFKIRLRKGDMVVVTKGRLKGQQGRVTATLPKSNKVMVENLNTVKKHLKPNKVHPQGGIIDIEKPIWVSKVALVEPKSQRPTKIGIKVAADGQKERIYKKTNQAVRSSSKAKGGS